MSPFLWVPEWHRHGCQSDNKSNRADVIQPLIGVWWLVVVVFRARISGFVLRIKARLSSSNFNLRLVLCRSYSRDDGEKSPSVKGRQTMRWRFNLTFNDWPRIRVNGGKGRRESHGPDKWPSPDRVMVRRNSNTERPFPTTGTTIITLYWQKERGEVTGSTWSILN